jgi:ATP-binding cassette subfamily B protein
MKSKSKNNFPLRWLWRVSGRNKFNILWLMLFQMLLGITDVAFAWLLRGIIDRAVAKDSQGFLHYAAGMVMLTITQIAIRAVLRFLVEYNKATTENRLKGRLFTTLLTKDYAEVTAVHSEEWMNRLTSDTVVVAEGMTTILPEVAGMLIKLTGALVMILCLVPGFAFVLIPGGIMLIFLTYAFRKVLKKLHKKIQEADGRLRVFLAERLSGLLVVKSFAGEIKASVEAVEKMEEHKNARMKRNHFSNICNIGFGLIMRGAYAGGALYCGYGILIGTMSYGTFTAVLQLIGQIQSPFANITGYLPKYYAMVASAERLIEAENFTGTGFAMNDSCFVANNEDIRFDKEEIRKFYQNDFLEMGLENAVFTYMKTLEPKNDVNDIHAMPIVIENLNLSVKKGEYIAFTGASGCGKSTLLKLFMCIYPLDLGTRYMEIRRKITAQSGEKAVDTAGTAFTTERIDLDDRYIRLFAYVPQGNHLMSGSIREVVTFGEELSSVQERKIWDALRIACADEFVKEMPDGLDTILGERGMGVSEGQMQRIAIARAIYSDNPILMLDESTSALDEQTEKKLLNNLKSMTDKTVLIVTHRPAILAICDRQVVMEEGGIEVDK